VLFRGAVRAAFALSFCVRHLIAPRALRKPTKEESMNESDASERPTSPEEAARAARSGRLLARPVPVSESETAQRGLIRLGLGRARDGLIYVPPGYEARHPAPLVLSLHGAGGDARQAMQLLQAEAERGGFIVLAVESRRATWDVLMGGFGPDVEFLNLALERTFGLYAVDPARVAVAGFSDGASYALSLGLTNGDLFESVLAFSPGFMAPKSQRGEPRIFISHGTHDSVLPIDPCSRRIVPQLQSAGYTVLYREFDGPHIVPLEVRVEAVQWWLSSSVSNTG
jgi:phospholipase/carboxylesterase